MSRLRRWGPAVLWAVAIFAMSSIPATELPPPAPVPHTDKLIHAAEYAVLGALLVRGWGRLLPAVAAAALLGAGDELWQALVPGRDSSVWDWVADCAGATAGALAARTRV